MNSQGSVSGVGVAELEPVPDLFSAGAESTTYGGTSAHLLMELGDEMTYIESYCFECVVLRANLRNGPSIIIRQDDILTENRRKKERQQDQS